MEPQHQLTHNRQPNALIYTRQEFTAVEKKIFFHVVNQINPKYGLPQTIFKEIVFDIPLKDIGIKNYKHIKDVVKKLQTRSMTLPTEDHEDFHSVIPFYEAQYLSAKKLVRLKLAPAAVPSFIDLKHGTSAYMYEIAMDLKGSYAQRFYEMLHDRKNNEEPWIISIKNLREYFNLDNVYEKTHDFQRYFLDVAKDELEERAGISFIYRMIRNPGSKSFTDVEFTVKLPKAEAIEAARKFMYEVSQMEPAQQMAFLEKLFTEYTFRKDQMKKIRNDIDRIGAFFEIHSRIITGQVIIKKDKTALVVKHLKLK